MVVLERFEREEELLTVVGKESGLLGGWKLGDSASQALQLRGDQ